MHKFPVMLLLVTFVVFANNSDELKAPDDIGNTYEANNGPDEYSCTQLNAKVWGFTKMKRAGIGLLIGGTALAVVGGLLVSSANGVTYYENDNGYESGSLTGATGAIFACVGVPMFFVGTFLTPIGIRKVREYKRRAKSQHCNLMFSLGYNSMRLKLAF